MSNNILIKVCGITDIDTGLYCAELGVDRIGLIFHPDSKRAIDIYTAKEIVDSLKKDTCKPVAVFVNSNAGEMLDICLSTRIQMVQLHGDLARISQHSLPDFISRIYAVPVSSEGTYTKESMSHTKNLVPKRDMMLFDYHTPGEGKTFNWKNFTLHTTLPWILAGGLTVANVTEAIQLLKPNGVDVSTGVENELGLKDKNLIELFVDTVRAIHV